MESPRRWCARLRARLGWLRTLAVLSLTWTVRAARSWSRCEKMRPVGHFLRVDYRDPVNVGQLWKRGPESRSSRTETARPHGQQRTRLTG